MIDGVEVGIRLHALTDDGKYYSAQVVQIATSAKRAKAPVQVNWVGYVDEEWNTGTQLK